MLLHNFYYALRVLFRDRILIFWTYAFPIILGTFFSLAFSNIENSERLDVVKIAVVENQAFQESTLWTEALAALSEEGAEEQLFSTRYTSEEEAEELLAEKKIVGYLKLSEEEAQVIVSSSGMEETVFQYAVAEIIQTKELVEQTVAYQIQQGVIPSEELFAGLYEEIFATPTAAPAT